MPVSSCVNYVISGASCPQLCFPTPAVQISITNVSPWLTSCFLSEEALISPHTCADRPKILKLELCMNVRLCVHKSESSCICVHAWMCQSNQGVSSTLQQSLLFLAFGHFRWFAGRHGSLPPPLKTRTLSDSASPLFCLVSVLRSHQAIKVTDIELWDKYVYKCCTSCLLKMLIIVALHITH